MGELSLVLHADPHTADPADAAERAVTELVGAGLLHREGFFVEPTRAALYFARLEEDLWPPAEVAEAFGRNLLFVRKRVGFSQEELARLAALHHTEICLA